MDAEQFSLKWNNFHSNLTSGFHALLRGEDLVDVTFAVEGKFLQAHKLVLSVCSPYFKQMFKIHPDKHPIIILKGVAYSDMSDILLFMYQGEVNVRQENLANFLKTAELLQIKGLTEDESSNDKEQPRAETANEKETNSDSLPQYSYHDKQEDTPASNNSPSHNDIPKRGASPKAQPEAKRHKISTANAEESVTEPADMTFTPKTEPTFMEEDYESSSMGDFSHIMENVQKDMSGTVMSSLASSVLQDSSQLDHGCLDVFSTVYTKMGKNGGKPAASYRFECNKCFKQFTRRDHLRTHEANIHGENKPLVCETCKKYYKNNESMRKHMAKYHGPSSRKSDSFMDISIMDTNMPPICVIDDLSS